jgi:multidrug efflux system outer membrane protein
MKRIGVLLLLCAGCTLETPYCRPQVELYPSWRIETPEQNEYCNLEWWSQIGDPLLTELIEKALANNQDLKVAIYRVDEFAANLGVVRSAQFPQMSGNFLAERQKISTTLEPIQGGIQSTFNDYVLILNATFQLDLWGQLQSATNAAYAELLSQVQNRRNVVLTLVGSVAKAYIDLKQYQLEHKISEETVESRKQSYELAKLRYSLGLTSEIQVDQSLSELLIAEVTEQQFQIQIALQEDLLSFLIGEPAHAICGGKEIIDFKMPPPIPTATPCELLSQRPDILSIEQQLIAANANVGVARSLFYPQVNIFGALDTESSLWRALFNGPSSTWEYGITIFQEIFTGGRLTSNLWEAQAQKFELVHTYQSTILNAVKEVNDALISHEITLDLVETQRKRVETLREYFTLSNLRYIEGLTDYLTVLDAERQLFRAELDLVETIGQSYTTLVDIYTTLGGGWVCEADALALGLNGR